MDQFTLNMYHHFVQLLVRESVKESHILISHKGIVQGSPELMFDYAIRMLRLAEKANEEYWGVTTPFCQQSHTCHKSAKGGTIICHGEALQAEHWVL